MSSSLLFEGSDPESQDLKNVANKLIGLVASYEQFTNSSQLGIILLSDINNGFSTVLSQMQSAVTYEHVLRSFYSGMGDVRNNMTLFKRYIVQPVSSAYSIPFTPIGSSASLPPEYQNSMQDTCIAILEYICRSMNTLSSTINYQTTFNLDLNVLIGTPSGSTPGTIQTSVVSDIKTCIKQVVNLTNFDSTMSLQTYMENCFTTMMTNATIIQENGTKHFYENQVFKRLILVVFCPYFVYQFILNHIPMSKLESANKAPRNAVIRRIAIQSAYTFQLYTLHTIYIMIARVMPSDNETYKLRLVMDANIMFVFNSEEEDMSLDSAYKELHTQTSQSYEKTQSLDHMSREIESVKNNLKTVAISEHKLNADISKAKAIKWAWFSFLILYIVFACLLIFIFNKSEMGLNILYLVGGVFALVLLIVGVINLSKKF